MSRDIIQLRYYGDKNANNWPEKSSSSAFTSGSAFENYYPIVNLKIYTDISDLSFRINGNKNNIILQDSPFELSADNGFSYIYQLSFDKNLKNIISSDNYLIIDIIYEK